MDKEVKTRLRALVSILGISNNEIAEKTGYTSQMVSKSLNPKYDVLTIKFFNRFFDAYSEVKKEYRQWVLEGTGKSPMLSDTKPNENLFGTDARIDFLEKENTRLQKQVDYFMNEVTYFKGLVAKALQLQPELQKQLNISLAQIGLGIDKMQIGNFQLPLGTNQGALA